MKDTLLTALKASGEILLGYFNKPMEIKHKESQSSIVTEADLASDSLIIKLISEKFPGHNTLSEETGFINRNSEYTWIIDPLDGTSNFAAGIPWFGVLISLLRENTPVMGGACLPTSDTLYFAEQGKGAFRNGKQFVMPVNRALKNSLVAFSLDYTDDEEFLNRGLEKFKYVVRNSRNVRSTNSLLDFLYVAEGKFGGCINLYTKIWDIAGLSLLISEAGGRMTDLYGNDLHFLAGPEMLEKNFPVVAGPGEIVSSLKWPD